MISVPLTRGYFALIDDCDAALARVKWRVMLRGKYTPYAIRHGPRPGGGKDGPTLLLHREVWARANPERPMPITVDHMNGEGLDCRRHNLRAATVGQNQYNQRLQTRSRSGFKGVRQQRNRWVAVIRAERKKHHVGSFLTAEEAARAYDAAARRLHGAFARLNFP